jgi:hypothetical protein
MDLTPDQIQELQKLGIVPPAKANYIPLLSISGLTLVSISGLLLFKTKTENIISPSSPAPTTSPRRSLPGEGGTQVPKSIEHYLLASQQLFTQALLAQNEKKDQQTIGDLLNSALSSATDAINLFPSDYRGYLQRGQLYQSLSDSQTSFIDGAIADLSRAHSLNPSSAEITRSLATLFAKKGDPNSTLMYLSKTVSLEPTKAQNFYDLALLQEQTGQINAAVTTYDRLLSILVDPAQKIKIETEKSALEKLLSQNQQPLSVSPTSIPNIPLLENSEPLIRADINQGLVIAAPETEKKISVSNLTESNSLSGTATLKTGETKISISNSTLTPSSQVYVSTISGGKNQTLEVLSKSADSFSIGLLSPSSDDITFKWWIVN